MNTNNVFKSIRIKSKKAENFLELENLDDMRIKTKCINLLCSPLACENLKITEDDFQPQNKEKIYDKVYNYVLTENAKSKLSKKHQDNKNFKKKNNSQSNYLPLHLCVNKDMKKMKKLLEKRKKEDKKVLSLSQNKPSIKNINNSKFVPSDNPYEVIKFFMDQKKLNGVSVKDIQRNLNERLKTEQDQTPKFTTNSSNNFAITGIKNENYFNNNIKIYDSEKFADTNIHTEEKISSEIKKKNDIKISNEYLELALNNKLRTQSAHLKLSRNKLKNKYSVPSSNIKKDNNNFNSDPNYQFFFTETQNTNENKKKIKQSATETNKQSSHMNVYLTSTKCDSNFNFTKSNEKERHKPHFNKSLQTDYMKFDLSFSNKEQSSTNSLSYRDNPELNNQKEIVKIETNEEKLQKLNEEVKLITESCPDKIKENSKFTTQYIKSAMIRGPVKSQFTALTSKITNPYVNVKSKYKGAKSIFETTFSKLLKKNQFMAANYNSKKSLSKGAYAKNSAQVFGKCEDSGKIANDLLMSCVKNNQSSKEFVKNLFDKQVKDWNYHVDKKLKEEGLAEYHSKGMFIYGKGQGYHLENYDRLYGIEREIKPYLSQRFNN